jgi:hypothetical protein
MFHFLLGDMFDSPGPSNDPLDPVPQNTGTNAVPDSSQPIDSQSAPNILLLHSHIGAAAGKATHLVVWVCYVVC